MKYRKIFLSAAAVAMVLCFLVIGVRGLNYSIEFVGGTSVTFHEVGDATIDQLRDAFREVDEPDAVIQTTNTDGQDGFLVRTTTTSSETATERAKTVADKFG